MRRRGLPVLAPVCDDPLMDRRDGSIPSGFEPGDPLKERLMIEARRAHDARAARDRRSSAPISPCPWNNGITLRQRSAGPSARSLAIRRADAVTFACVSGTTFGRAVVPDVCRTNAWSCGALRGPIAKSSPVSASMWNSPAPSEASLSISSTPMPDSSATVRIGPRSERNIITRPDTGICEKRPEFGPREAGLSGTQAAYAATPRTAVAISGPLGNTTAMRVVARAPRARRAAPTRCACRHRPAYVSGGRSGSKDRGRIGLPGRLLVYEGGNGSGAGCCVHHGIACVRNRAIRPDHARRRQTGWTSGNDIRHQQARP